MAGDTKRSPATRLYFIVARRSSMAVVFRRGPTKQVELLTWNLGTDELTPGQWLKGRIYERRCDLSPDGQLLVYFAAKYGTPMYSWTAISRPPYLTALNMWRKGDGWGGGGLFASNASLLLNHHPPQTELVEGYSLLPGLRVSPFGENPGRGEDDPIHHTRLLRDGWTWVDHGSKANWRFRTNVPYFLTYDPPLEYVPALGRGPNQLRMFVHGHGEQQGVANVLSYELVHDGEQRDLGRADWADSDHNGDLLLAREGRLFRLAGSDFGSEPREVADLRSHRFEERQAPAEALRRR
jgi:hypothetical protein